MELTKGQLDGLKIAVNKYRNGERYTVISGFAGTGKSTLVRFIIEALHIPKERVCYTAFTGKATQVLQQKGNSNCLTLHKLLYKSYPRPDGSFFRIPKDSLEYSFIVVDECSMAPIELVRLLLSHPVYVLFLGDPF